jgi:glycosyltransferase involved in cell wall biosynthesis
MLDELKMEIKISVILPSRRRPRQLDNFLKSLFKSTKKPKEVEIILCLDEDDDSYHETISPFKNIVQLIGPRRSLGEITHAGIEKSTGDIIFLCNDDIEVSAYGWDEDFRDIHKQYADKIYLIGPNDLNKAPSLLVFPAFSRRVYNNLSNFPKMYSGAFIDAHINEIFSSLKHNGEDRIHYFNNIHFAHRHFRVTGHKPDEVYIERNRFGDDGVFLLHAGLRYQNSKALKNLIKNNLIAQNYNCTHYSIIKSAALYLSGKHVSYIKGIKILVYMFMRKLFVVFFIQK